MKQTPAAAQISPIPWHAYKSTIGATGLVIATMDWRADPDSDDVAIPATKEDAEANAAFIVLAVNNHTRLVEALKELHDATESGYAAVCGTQDWTPEFRQSIRMRIATASMNSRNLLASLEPSYPPSLTSRESALVEALKEIAEGKGAFNQDPMIHASNVIADMKRIAEEALASLEQA